MMKKIKLFVLQCILVIPGFALAATESDKINLDLQNVNVQDALRYVAKMTNMNIILSPDVTGAVTLRLHNIAADDAFDLILHSRGLTRVASQGVWLIGTDENLIRQKQQQEKLQDVLLNTAKLTTQIWQMHYAKADNVAMFIHDEKGSFLTKRGSVHVDMRTNRLCVQDTMEAIAAIDKVIKKMDIPVQQVLIETRLASIDQDFERELGVNFSVLSGDRNDHGLSSSPVRYSLAVARLADGSTLDMQLAALENEGHGELISSPRLFTQNYQAASIESGEEIPYQEVSRSGATGVSFKKAVLSLKVIPEVFPDHKILLQLQINQDKPANRVVLGVPAITTRQISTSILARDGQTIVLGGIFETNKEDLQQRVPFLGKIPLVGRLFSQQNVVENKRELLIFVTPKIVNTNGMRE